MDTLFFVPNALWGGLRSDLHHNHKDACAVRATGLAATAFVLRTSEEHAHDVAGRVVQLLLEVGYLEKIIDGEERFTDL